MAKTALPRWPLKLKARFPDRNVPKYRTLYSYVVDGLIPGEFEAGRIYIDDAYEDVVAAVCGLLAPEPRTSEADQATARTAA